MFSTHVHHIDNMHAGRYIIIPFKMHVHVHTNRYNFSMIILAMALLLIDEKLWILLHNFKVIF